MTLRTLLIKGTLINLNSRRYYAYIRFFSIVVYIYNRILVSLLL
jgi:hypothetical protein